MPVESSTKPEQWIFAIAFIMILSFGLYAFGAALQNNNATLDDDSTDYIANFTSKIGTVGITARANQALDEEETKNPFQNALTTIRDFFDVFGVLTLLTNILVGLWTFISFMFNMPNFFIETLGLNTGDWGYVVNIVSYVMTLLATIMFVRLKK